MNIMHQYLANILNLGLDPKQKQFYQWELAKIKAIKITPFAEIALLTAQKQKLKRLMQFKDCYGNAVKICEQIPTCRYVEGYMLSMNIIPEKHAWNKINNQYFDVTAERFFSGGHEYQYYQILNLSRASLSKAMTKAGTYGDVESTYFISHILKE